MRETDSEFKERRIGILKDLIASYCNNVHGQTELCDECKELLDYALIRIDRCPNNITRIPCSRCPCPCYSDEMRNRMKTVMDHSKPYFRRHPRIRFRFKFA